MNPYDALRKIEELTTFNPDACELDRVETMGRINMIAWQAINREPKPASQPAAQEAA